jgi:hypothetical protein
MHLFTNAKKHAFLAHKKCKAFLCEAASKTQTVAKATKYDERKIKIMIIYGGRKRLSMNVLLWQNLFLIKLFPKKFYG